MRRRHLGLFLALASLAACEAPPPIDSDAGVELRGFAEHCRATEDCESGLCLEVAPGRGVCTRACESDADCPSGEPWGCVSPRRLGARVCGCAADSDEEQCGDGVDNECDGEVDDCRICDGVPVPEDAHDHCGECGRACRDDQECSAGECRCAVPGTLECGGRCVDTSSDDLNCGACGAACTVDRTCIDGACVCTVDRPDRCVDASGLETCVDLQTDEGSCGACGHRCPTGQVCLDGACACPDSGVDHCGGVGCVDLDNDVAHCGACQRACRAGEICSFGECTCPIAGRLSCGGSCVDVSSSTAHCGACGVACLPGERCVAGACACDSGIVCDGVCTYIDDPSNCGACGNACGADEVCTRGACRCRFGVDCGGTCTDVLSNEESCGACGVTCGAGQSCVSGTCRCNLSGWIYCDAAGACVDPRADAQHCGVCGNACPSGQECVSGACRCPTGLTWCVALGACVDLRSDEANCGACGNACPAAQQCTTSSCRCPMAGETYCADSGTCEPLASDSQNCGACGNVCPAALICSSYSCRCPTSGETYCDAADACFDLRADPLNCGSCGNACPSGTICSAGACQCPVGGETLCGTTCADLTSDPAHCGTCGNVCTGIRTCESGACRCPAPIPGALTRFTTTPNSESGVEIATDGSRVAFVWTEQITGRQPAIRFTIVDASGSRLLADRDLSVPLGDYSGGSPDVAWSGTEWGVVWTQRTWTDGVGSGRSVFFQRIASDGTPIGAPADVAAHWLSPAGAHVSVAYSATKGWAVVSGPGTFQALGLDGSARPFPVRPRTVSGGSTRLDLVAVPDGRFGFANDTELWIVNADGTVTLPPIPTGLQNTRLGWDGEGFAVVGNTGRRVELRRGPGLTEVHLVHEYATETLREFTFAVRGPSALVAWTVAPGTSYSRIDMARVALPIGGASFGILSPTAIVMPDYSVDNGPPELVQFGSNAMLTWGDTRWGQREVYALPLGLGACL